MLPFVSLPLRPLRCAVRRPFPIWAALFVGSLVFVCAGLFWLAALHPANPRFEELWKIGAVLCGCGIVCLIPANWLYFRK